MAFERFGQLTLNERMMYLGSQHKIPLDIPRSIELSAVLRAGEAPLIPFRFREAIKSA